MEEMNCDRCDRPLLSQRAWRSLTDEERQALLLQGFGKAANGRLCTPCYRKDRKSRGTLARNPALPPLGRPRSIPATCSSCGLRMVSQSAWLVASLNERQEMRADGYVAHGVGTICRRCKTNGEGFLDL
jgi:hypothetical protein